MFQVMWADPPPPVIAQVGNLLRPITKPLPIVWNASHIFGVKTAAEKYAASFTRLGKLTKIEEV